MALSPSDFFTRTKANEGVKMPLSLPDGTPTDEYLIIRGVDSDVYRKANDKRMRRAIEISKIEDDEEREAALKELTTETLVSLVAGWSFEEECTPEAVRELLYEAPHIADAIDVFAVDRKRFFGKPQGSSLNTRKRSSDSASHQKGRKSR